MNAGPAGRIRVTVSWSPAPREVREVDLLLEEGATVRDALERSGMDDMARGLGVGVWGRLAAPSDRLQERDRVEIYRPLRADPKTARRERFAAQGSRGTGLFARRRDGGKSGD